MYQYLQNIGIRCTGCGACVNACPVDAIGYQENLTDDGSIVAVIDSVKCVGCNKCRDICPQINLPRNPNASHPICYAVMANDEIREKSSSGGAFPVMAEHILALGGEVCGVAWDSTFEAEFIMVSDQNEMEKLCRSKYVQSRVGYIYREIRTKLEAGKRIMFVGCPCQVAGLKAYLGMEYDRLLLVDLYCNYAPSPIVLRKYLHENFDVSEISHIDFRVKNYGWVCDIHRIAYKNGCTEERRPENDTFQKGYHPRLFMRKVCEECKYSGFPRQGDISIGDFWYINHFHVGLDDLKGTSCVLLNNEKGRNFFAEIKDRWKLSKTVGLDCMRYNRGVDVNAHPARDRFYELIKKDKFNESVEKAMSGRYDAVVWGCWSERNYGSELTYYALYKFLQMEGLDALMVERPERASWRPTGVPILFEENPYPRGALCSLFPDKRAMRSLNNVSDLFIVGSDQIWHSNLYRAFGEAGCLDYIFNDKKKIAFAASFGREQWDGDEAETQEIRTYLGDFDSISVREQSGVNICREVFGTEAKAVLDPVFLCDSSVYLELANKSTMEMPEQYIGAYILDIDEDKTKFLSQIQNRLGIPLNVITDAFDESVFDRQADPVKPHVGASCEDWLKNIICSDFVVTDSFHGMCFAIIFKKRFVAITNKKRGTVRFSDLLGRLDLTERMVFEENLPGSLDESIFGPISYEAVYQVLKEKKAETIAWFRKALETPKKMAMTRYDLLFRQLVEDGWRLNQSIQEERGARQWDISIHQSKINEIFDLIHDMEGQIAALRVEQRST